MIQFHQGLPMHLHKACQRSFLIILRTKSKLYQIIAYNLINCFIIYIIMSITLSVFVSRKYNIILIIDNTFTSSLTLPPLLMHTCTFRSNCFMLRIFLYKQRISINKQWPGSFLASVWLTVAYNKTAPISTISRRIHMLATITCK